MIFGYSKGCPLTLRVPLRTLFLKSAAHLHLKYRLPGRSLPFRNFEVPKIQIRMESRSESAEKTQSNPIAGKIQELVNNSTSTDGWDKCWEQGLTPWDLGYPTPVILHLLQTGALPSGRVLVPGCGSGYDVVALASPERYVVGLDISENALKQARELFSLSPNSNYFTFLKADFFTWNPTELFDLIFDYTFFCAIEPCKRLAWANRVRELLKPDGELITLMFPIGVHAGGPPYTVSVADYKEVLHPMGFEAVFVEDNNLAIKPRKGREKLGRWKRVVNKSLL